MKIYLDILKLYSIFISGGRICSFSPCIEQVQRTCETLTVNGFVELKTFECLLRNHDVKTINLPKADLGPTDPLSSTKAFESEKTETSESTDHKSETNSESRAKVEVNSDETVPTEKKRTVDSDIESGSAKKQKTEKLDNTRHHFDLIGFKDEQSFFFKTAAPPVQMPGHTGFLTFATLYPS